MASQPMLRLKAMRVQYGKLVAVHGADLDVRSASITVLLGLNGAGKSSIMNAVAGLVPVESGTIEFCGSHIQALPAYRRSRSGLAFLPEGRGVFPSLTVEQNVRVGTRQRSHDAEALETAFDLFPVLGQRRTQAAGSLSGGEQQMLSLARCLASRPSLLLLDEPSLGLATKIVHELFEKLAQLRDAGLSVVMVEQFAHAALAIADTAGVLVRGELTAFGDAAAMRSLSPAELAEVFFTEVPHHDTDDVGVTHDDVAKAPGRGRR